ncbi:MAG: dihydrodipicolinate synthase family protein [Pirellulales bacterium]|nr:dihydrodipicolinate synthase family protein [Pirellulales bacterium]
MSDLAVNSVPRRVQGIVVPLASPLKSIDELDVGALEQLVEHVIAGGVSGLFLLGTCGEGVSLSHRLQRELVERVCRQTANRVRVLACVTDTSPGETAALIQFAAEAGADTVVVAPPFYLPLSQSELSDYLLNLAAQSPLPVMLYNMPDLTKIPIEISTVRRLMDHPRVIGVKDSSGNLAYFEQLCRLSPQRNDWSVMIGPEHLLAQAIAMGAQGGVAGGANLFPRLFVDLYRAATTRSDRLEELVALADRLNAVYGNETASAATVIKGLKASLAALDIGNGRPAPPLAPLEPAERARIERVVLQLKDRL